MNVHKIEMKLFMELEKQVVSLELAKRMKELGFTQESYFYFKRTIDFSDYESEQLKIGDSYDLCYDESEFCEHSSDNKISAYTVAELGQFFPYRKKWRIRWHGAGHSIWLAGHTGFKTIKEGETEADARAKMLIYLKENNLI